MAEIITIGAYKGGVGKSTLTEVLSYIYTQHDNKKVLVVDADPQANVTYKLCRTFNQELAELLENKNRLMYGIYEADIRQSIVNITNNLDLAVGDWNIEQFDEHIRSVTKGKRNYILNTLLSDVQSEYDYVLIDTRPSTGKITNNALCASDYVLITSKTEEDSFISTIQYLEHLKYEIIEYNPDLNLLGIVNYLINPKGYVDKVIMERYEQEFNDLMFDSHIKSSEVVKRWGLNGITEHRPYDKRVLAMYRTVADEIETRIRDLEEVKS